MPQEKLGLPDWEKLDWQKTPYSGVFLYLLDEKPNPENPAIPLSSSFALKVDPASSIPRHIHKREPEWRENLTFPGGGNFEISRVDGPEIILNVPLTLTIKPNEAFGLKNHSSRPLFFTSVMKPGFTGYEEIEEIEEIKE